MAERDEGEVFERVMDQGMEIVVLCHFGRRDMPSKAFLMRFTPEGYRESIVRVPVPVCVRDDVLMPRQWPERPMNYGRH